MSEPLTKEEIAKGNREIGHWLWPSLVPCKFSGCDHQECHQVKDFLHDEAASALVLEKLHLPRLDKRHTGWHVTPFHEVNNTALETTIHADRKTAIFLAALALIRGGKQ